MQTRAGKLRDFCIFSTRKVGDTDEHGNLPQGWDEITRTRGDMMERASKDRLVGGVVTSRESAMIRVRDTPFTRQVQADDRVQVRGRTYVVRGRAQMEATPRMIEMELEVLENPENEPQ